MLCPDYISKCQITSMKNDTKEEMRKSNSIGGLTPEGNTCCISSFIRNDDSLESFDLQGLTDGWLVDQRVDLRLTVNRKVR